MNPTARLITTLKCNRDCSYCCNKHDKIIARMKPLKDLNDLAGYQEIIITGGEPLIDLHRTHKTVVMLRDLYPNVKLFLYGSDAILPNSDGNEDAHRVSEMMGDIFLRINGFTWTVHKEYTERDLILLNTVQVALFHYRDGAGCDIISRLSLDPDIDEALPIYPVVWNSIKIKRWRTKNEVCLPEHEDLWIME